MSPNTMKDYGPKMFVRLNFVRLIKVKLGPLYFFVRINFVRLIEVKLGPFLVKFIYTI